MVKGDSSVSKRPLPPVRMFFRKNRDPRRNTYDDKGTAQEKCKMWKELVEKLVIKSDF